MRKKGWVLGFLCAYFSCFAQENVNYSATVGAFYGEGVGNIKGIESNFVQGIRVGVSKELYPESAEWIEKLNAERVNVSFLFNDLNGMQLIYKYGQSYALTSSLEMRLLDFKAIKLYFVPEVGLAYITETVHTNPETFIFGSHINFYFGAGLAGEIRFLKDLSVVPYAQLMHYSNGSVRLPNAGLNAITYGVGIRKYFNSSNKEIQKSDSIHLKTDGIELAAGFGWRGKYKRKDRFFRMSYYAGYSRFFNQTFALRAGVDVGYYDQVYNPAVYEDTVPYWGKSYEHYRAGLSIGGEVKLSRLALNANIGRYVYMKSPYDQKAYWNAAFRYYLVPKLGIQATLHAHKFQADFVSMGLFARL